MGKVTVYSFSFSEIMKTPIMGLCVKGTIHQHVSTSTQQNTTHQYDIQSKRNNFMFFSFLHSNLKKEMFLLHIFLYLPSNRKNRGKRLLTKFAPVRSNPCRSKLNSTICFNPMLSGGFDVPVRRSKSFYPDHTNNSSRNEINPSSTDWASRVFFRAP